MNTSSSRVFDVLVVGAGFSGLYALHHLRSLGFSVRVLETGGGLGGTWYWNRYPGARCDVPSVEYSFSFSEELQAGWEWSEKYATQSEILAYLEYVADRLDLRRDIQFDTKATRLQYDDDRRYWTLETEAGEEFESAFVVMATGVLSVPYVPSIDGMDRFAGTTVHTATWPPDGVDFSGLRVGVIGTGSSGIQCIPLIAAEAKELFVFQRTPNFSVPARNAPLDDEYRTWLRTNYPELRRSLWATNGGTSIERNGASALDVGDDERRRIYEERWVQGSFAFLGSFSDLLTNREANETAAEFVREKIKGAVNDQNVAGRLLPRDHALGAKRMCVDTDYYETFNRPNVTLVDTRESPIEAITPEGVRTTDSDYALDTIVLATGFDAMTGALLAMDIRGRSGAELRKRWEAGPRTFLGIGTVGFPNLFIVAGSGSPSILSNMVMAIEHHVRWIGDCLSYMRAHGLRTIEVTETAEEEWVTHSNALAAATLFPTASSWYVGANVPGKPRVFLLYVGAFREYGERCDRVARDGYPGFAFDADLQ